MRGAATLIAVAAALLPVLGQAQAFDPRKGFNPPISDELVDNLSGQVLNNMAKVRCGERPCAPATEAEKSRGLISRRDAREVIRKGMVSAVGDCVGLDWRQVGFTPMMAEWNKRRNVTERQLAFVGELHRATMLVSKAAAGANCTGRSN